MTTRWSSDDEIDSGGIFETLHSGLTVALITTARETLVTCCLSEPLSDVVSRSAGQQYDYLPVKNDERSEIVGLLHTIDFAQDSPRAGIVMDRYRPLSEGDLMGVDASILDFIKDADSKPRRLVISGDKIVGFVTLSDLQKLPVRAALFALITGLEITMYETIKQKYPTGEEWKQHLTVQRRKSIKERIDNSAKGDGFVDDLLFTQFCDKRDIIIKSFPFSRKKELRIQLKDIEKLRDKLAHANEYAATQTEAKNVCKVIRNLLEIREKIKIKASGIANGSKDRASFPADRDAKEVGHES